MSAKPNPQMIENERARRMQEQQLQQAGQMAGQRASQSGPSLDELQSTEFIDAAFKPHFDKRKHVKGVEDLNLEAKYSAEFSRHQGLGFITRSDWEDEASMNRARAILAKQEFARPNGLGSKCRPALRKAWTNVDEPLQMLTDDTAREITAAFEEKTMTQSLSVDGRGFSGLTEVTAVSRSEGVDPNTSSGGLLAKVTGALSR